MLRPNRRIALLALIFGSLNVLAAAEPLAGQDVDPNALSARVWLDQGEEPVLQTGDRVRVYYRSSADAYVTIIQINTDGFAQIVYPASPEEDGFTRGGRDYRLLLPQSPYWYVDDAAGMGYFFILASPEPLDFSGFPYSFSEGGWDLSLVGQNIYTDPYVAIDEFVTVLLPQWETVDYALDFLTYNVGQTHEYPRFMCYECHGYQPYYAWNPYFYSCTSFRVVIWDDPYYYPAYRYAGTAVVWTRPPVAGGYPRFGFKERADGEPGTPQVIRRDPGSVDGVAPPEEGGRGGVGAPASSSGTPRTPIPLEPGVAPTRGDIPTGRRVGPIGGYRPPRTPPAGTGTGSAQTGSTSSGRTGVVPLTRTGGEGTVGVGEPTVRARPTLQRRPGGSGTGMSTSNGGRSGVSQTPPRSRVPGGTTPPRPSARVRSTTAGSSDRSQPATRGGTRVQSRPTTGSARPSTRSTPTVNTRTGGSRTTGSARPTVRPRPSGGSPSRPAAKPKSGGASPRRPAVKPKGGGGTPPRPTVKPKGGGGSSRPPAIRPKGGGALP